MPLTTFINKSAIMWLLFDSFDLVLTTWELVMELGENNCVFLASISVAIPFSCFTELTVCEFCFTMLSHRVCALRRVCSLLPRHSMNSIIRIVMMPSLCADSSSE